eukprot:g27255.t1
MSASSRAAKRAAKKARKKQVKEAQRELDSASSEVAAAIQAKKAELEAKEAAKREKKAKKEGGGAMDDDEDEVAVKEEDESKYVAEDLTAVALPPQFAAMASVFENFQKLTVKKLEKDEEEDVEAKKTDKKKNKEDKEEKEEKEKNKLSRRQRRLQAQENIAKLKNSVDRPELIEMHDCNSTDPPLLVYLKAYRNTVPVPDHWLQKRKYLQNKRGVEKTAFELPDYIAATGITKIRQAQQDKASGQTAKQSAKSRVNPNMGRMDIDYQILHDAFFRHQTKPKLTVHGDLYHEGKEFEVKVKSRQPGDLSDDLMRALGMTLGKKSPPPWLFNMQRWGPPPTYSALDVPGVNAPIPEGCRYGYGENEWGTPPTDEFGRPLYGDVFGTVKQDEMDDGFDRALWGQIQEEEEEEEDSSEEEEEEEGEGEEGEMEGTTTSESMLSGMGTATPQTLQLRKQDGTGSETPQAPVQQKSLYTVLEEKKTSVGSGQLFGSQHTYVVPKGVDKRAPGQIDVSLNPDELEGLDAQTLKRKYDTQLAGQKAVDLEARAEVSAVAQEEMQKRKKRKTGKDAEGKEKFKF